MGVWTVRIFRTGLPVLAIFLAVISLLFTLLAGLRRNDHMDNNFVFKVDARNFWSQVPKESNLTPANSIGLKNYYYIYLWNHCESNRGMDFTYCSKPRFDYYFNSVRLLKARLKRDVKVRIPANSKSYHDRLRVTSYSVLISLVLGLLLLLTTFVFVLIVTLAGSTAVFTSVLSGVSTLVLIIGSAVVTGQYLELKRLIRDKADYLRVKATEGKEGLLYLWLSCVFSLISFVSLLLAVRFIRNKREAAAKLYR